MGVDSKSKKKSLSRNCSGATLTEMLVASLLLGLTMAAIGEVMVIMTVASNKLSNRAGGLSDSRTAKSRIQMDVRSASNFGDSYDTLHEDTTVDRNGFPCSDNPLYDAVSGPTFSSALWSWSGWPVGWTQPPYLLDAQTLIIQKPKLFDAVDPSQEKFNGFPLMLERGKIQAGGGGVTAIPVANSPNMDTVVYKLIEDPDEPGEYILQRAVFVGVDDVSNLPTGGSNFSTMINPPQTVVKGITGPSSILGGTIPEIFTYYRQSSSSNIIEEIDISTINSEPDLARLIVGVGIDIELKKPSSAGTSNVPYQQRMGIHSEAFLRSTRGISASNPN